MKNYATMIATAFLGGAMTLGGYKLFIDKHDAKQEALDCSHVLLWYKLITLLLKER